MTALGAQQSERQGGPAGDVRTGLRGEGQLVPENQVQIRVVRVRPAQVMCGWFDGVLSSLFRCRVNFMSLSLC